MPELLQRKLVATKTTLPILPFLPSSQRRPFRTKRLILRPLKDDEDDLKSIHAVRASTEVMEWSTQLRPDTDLDETHRNFFESIFGQNDTKTFIWGIFLAETGECIGHGGNRLRAGKLGWPEVGYNIKRDAWGHGYATEFLEGFLEIWWALPRETVEIEVDVNTINGDGGIKDECIVGLTRQDNNRSNRVLEKNSFEMRRLWEEEDLRDETKMILLCGWAVSRKDR